MEPKEHVEAVRSLARCYPTVGDHHGNFFWKVDHTVMPTAPTGCWYLYFGKHATMPTELMALVKRRDGQSVGSTSPQSSILLSFSYTSSPHPVTVPWKNKSPNLVAPALKAIVPRDLVMHARWEHESATIKRIGKD